MVTRQQNRKMKLTMVRNTYDGVEQIGCRASGIYKGYHIERTAWVPFSGANLVADGGLRRLATGQYEREKRKIDEAIKQDNNAPT